MRRLAFVVALSSIVLRGALASDLLLTINNLFSDTLLDRLHAQQTFYSDFIRNQHALSQLTEKSLANLSNVRGVYDALSLLNRVPPETITDETLIDKIRLLAERAKDNSAATARIASSVHSRFGAGALENPGRNSVVSSFFSDQLADRLQAQRDFLSQWSSNQDAVRLLVEKASENLGNVQGIYDSLSVLDRTPIGTVTAQDLKTSILMLAEKARGNSAATAKVASRVHVRFGGSKLTTYSLSAPDGSSARTADTRVAASVTRDLQSQSFLSFKQDTAGLTYEQAVSGIHTTITSTQFDTVVASSQSFYATLPVVTTIQVPTPDRSAVISFDCVPRTTQPAFSAQAGPHALPGPAAEQDRTVAPQAPKLPFDPDVRGSGKDLLPEPVAPPLPPEPVVAPTVPQNPPVSLAENDTPSCPAGTVAIPRVSVGEALASDASQPSGAQQHPVLDGSILRDHLNMGTVAPATPFAHRYAHAVSFNQNHGAAADLNVWSPKVVSGDMSLSQIWVVGADVASNTVQTVEAGWQVLSLWQTPFATTFIYSTSDSYQATGCYVTKCAVNVPRRPETFQLVTNKIIVGRPIPQQSISTGAQAVQQTRIFRDPATGNWWVSIDGEWVGFYPKDIFNGGPLSRAATYADFGGETAGLIASAEMGSGHYAEEGLGHAAYEGNLRFYDLHDRPVNADPLAPVASDKDCYTVVIGKQDPAVEKLGTHFFFGGPGTKHFQNGGGGSEQCEH